MNILGGEPLVETSTRFANERLALHRLGAAGCLSHDDSISLGRTIPRDEGSVSQGTLLAVSEWSLGLHAEVLGARGRPLDLQTAAGRSSAP
jgi:hypothetical protein